MPHRMSGKYEIHLTSLRYRGAPDSSMEDRIAPLRSVDHRQHSERHRAWGLAPMPQLPFFLTPGVETSCRNSLQCNGISRHNTPCYSGRSAGAFCSRAYHPISHLGLCEKGQSAWLHTVLGWKESRILLRPISEHY